MNHPVKRRKVYNNISKLCAEIIFLQETHIKQTAKALLNPHWAAQIYQSNFSNKTRGVAIIIKKNVPFIHKQTISDKYGRYIIVRGEINAVPITLVNLYGPNYDDPSFFNKLLVKIPDAALQNVIIGGDFNCVIDPIKDTRPSRTFKSKSAATLNNYFRNINMVDIWRHLNPYSREYSFYSSVHKSYSRIDLFVVDSNLIKMASSSQYHNRLISDHAPLSLDLKIKLEKGTYCWKFDNSLLNDNFFCNYITEKIGYFLSENDNGSVNESVLWDSMKAVIRGEIISFQSRKNKEDKKRLNEIDDQITKLEENYKTNLCSKTLKKIVALRSEYNSILSKTIVKQINQINNVNLN